MKPKTHKTCGICNKEYKLYNSSLTPCPNRCKKPTPLKRTPIQRSQKPIKPRSESKNKIDKKVSETKRLIIEKYPYCQVTGETGVILDCAHIISEKKCKEIGKKELCYDENNIIRMSRHLHNIWDNNSKKSSWQDKKKAFDFVNAEGTNWWWKILRFIEKNDIEQFNKIKVEL